MRLIAWMRGHDPHPKYVFTTSYRTSFTPGAMQKRMRRLVKLHGLDKKVSPYGARRLFGTTAIMNGSDLSTTAELMGNSPAILQKHYVQLSGQIDHLRQKVACGMPSRIKEGAKPKKPVPRPPVLSPKELRRTQVGPGA